MNRCHYYVIYDEEGWKIQCDGENSEPYPHRRVAFRDAVGLAHLDAQNGRQAEVLVQDDDQILRTRWDSATDTYPPPLVPEL